MTRRQRFRVVGAVALSGALVASCGDDRGGDVPRIRAALEAIPGVTVTDVAGWDELWPVFAPEFIRALEVGNGGHLVLCNLTPRAFTGEASFGLARVGDWAPEVESEGPLPQEPCICNIPTSFTVGAGSPIADVLPLKLRTVADVIARYQELERLVSSWPVPPACDPDSSGRVHVGGSIGWVKFEKTPYGGC